MFTFSSITKSSKFLPLLISRRGKVRILPKEKYGDDETPFMKVERRTTGFGTNFYSIVQRKNLTLAHLRSWSKRKHIESIRSEQRYMPERHKTLGPDLATACFITYRGGIVKLAGRNKWTTKEDIETNKIPSSYQPGYFVEEIDASKTNLCYEGFDNLCSLQKLKRLYIRHCPFIDDWCLGRFHLLENTLEYLDITGCQLVTERGICAISNLNWGNCFILYSEEAGYILPLKPVDMHCQLTELLTKKLKTLVIKNTPNIRNKELVSLLLQEVIPECEIVGVDYANPLLLKKLENFL